MNKNKNKILIKENIIYQSFIKYKRITQSILTLKLYIIIYEINTIYTINTIITIIIKQFNYKKISIIVYTNLYSLYKCIIKLKVIKKKRFIINLIIIK